MKNNFKITLLVTALLFVISTVYLEFSILGFISGILYAQIIEWFVHGWIQHYPFKIFKPYRTNHDYHHAHPNEPRSVQPIQYFLIGSILILGPFWWFNGFISGYFITYLLINVIHYDLHTTKRILPYFIWDTPYFKLMERHHLKHHTIHDEEHSTNSVTNPYLDMLFDKIKLTKLNNFIAKNLKI